MDQMDDVPAKRREMYRGFAGQDNKQPKLPAQVFRKEDREAYEKQHASQQRERSLQLGLNSLTNNKAKRHSPRRSSPFGQRYHSSLGTDRRALCFKHIRMDREYLNTAR